jgi:hypothetical protein
MHPHDAVVHLTPVTVPLPSHTRGLVPALGDPRLVHHADRFRMSMVLGQDLLATVVESFFIPLDGFEETL